MARKSLLLVDADPRSLRVLEVSLRKAGYNLATAGDGTTALSMIASSTPDLVLSDTRLPGLDGFALVESIRRNPDWGTIPIMFLSSDPAVESKVRGLQLGVEDYLTKPIYIKEIVARINIALARFERDGLARGRQSLSKTRFTGSLGDMGLVDLLQTIEISRKSGVLEVHSGQRTGLMTFREGQILDAELGTLHGERALYRVLLFSEGDFEIDFRPVKTEQQIRTPTQGLLMEGMRRLDEWGRLLEQIPPIASVMEINEDELAQRLAELPDEINAVLKAIDGQRSLEEVIDVVEGDDLHTLSTLSKLFFEGVIQPTGRSRTLRPTGAAPTGETEDVGPAEDDAHFEHGLVPAGDGHPEDRANPDDASVSPVPTRASVVPPAMPADVPVPTGVDLAPAPIPRDHGTLPAPAAAPPADDREAAPQGTIDATAAAEPVAAPQASSTEPVEPDFSSEPSIPSASAARTFDKKSTLMGPGFEAMSLTPASPSEAEADASDSEEVMSKKNKKKNRGGEGQKQDASKASVETKAVVETKPAVVETAVEKAEAEAKKAGEAQTNVIQFPAKRSGVSTQIAVNDDVATTTTTATTRSEGRDETAPRLRTDDGEEDEGDDEERESAPTSKALPGELPKVIVEGAAPAKKELTPAAPPPNDRRSRREERRQKKSPSTTSGEIRALGTGETSAVSDDFFRAKGKEAAPAVHDDFSDLGPADELPKQGRQAMYATIGIVLGFSVLIGAFVYYQQVVLPTPHELGHAGPVELPHATAHTPTTTTTAAPATTVAPPATTEVAPPPPTTEAALAPEVAPEGEGEGDVVPLPPEEATEVAEAEAEEVAALPPPEQVEATPPPPAAGETYESVLAEADAARRRPSTAIPLYERAIALNPTGSEALAQLSFLLLNRGRRPDLEQARDYALRATQSDATSSLAWLVLGAARDSLGDRTGARDAYRSCVEQGQGAHVRECRALAH